MAQTFAPRQFIPQATVSSTSTPSRMCLNASSSHVELQLKKNAELGSIRTGGSCNNLSSRINLKQKMRKGRGSLEPVRASATTTSALAADQQHRSVLGVGPDATRQDIRQAYRRLALQFHPDVCKEKHYTSSFMEVNCAYEYLINTTTTTTTTTSATTRSPDYYYSSGSSSYYCKQQQGPSRASSASMEQNYYSNCSTTTSSSSFSEFGSMFYKSTIHKSPTTAQGPGDGEDDPWADFLQSIVQGTFEESKHYSPVDYQNFPPADNIMDQQQSSCWTRSSSSSRVNSSSSSSSSSSSAHRRSSAAAAASSTLDGDW